MSSSLNHGKVSDIVDCVADFIDQVDVLMNYARRGQTADHADMACLDSIQAKISNIACVNDN